MHGSPQVGIILFRIWIIHEGEPLHCLSSGLSSFKPGQYLSYNLLLGNNQEICPVVCFFFFSKGCSQGRCPDLEKDKPIRILLSLCISAAHFDISALSVSLCVDSCRCSSSSRCPMAPNGSSLNV